MSFICHIHNYTEYNQQWNVFSAFNPSKCTHMEQWAADTAAPGEQFAVRCLARGPFFNCRGQFLPEPRFEPTTSGYKSDALSTRPRLWGTVKRKIRNKRPKNADELKAAVKETWASTPPQQCHKLITSMPRRIEAVIKAKGAPTKYWVHIQ